MFYECENLLSLNLSSFKNKKTIDISYMFYCCKNLSTLDLSNFDIKSTYNYNGIFYNCNKLKDINNSTFDINKFNISKDIFFDTNLSERNQELMLFLYNNIINNANPLKVKVPKIQNNFPFLQSELKYNNLNINSNCILISNDIILIPTRLIYIDNTKPNSLSFPEIKENIEYNANNFIVENDDYNNNFSVIKVLNKNFFLKNILNYQMRV